MTEKEVLEIGRSVVAVGRVIRKLDQQDQDMRGLPGSRGINERRARGLAIRFRVPGGRRN